MNPQPPPETFSDLLLEHRREVDRIDAQLVALLAERFAVTNRIGALKAAHGVSAGDPAREQVQLERLLALSVNSELPHEVTRTIFEILFRFVRANHHVQAEAKPELAVDD